MNWCNQGHEFYYSESSEFFERDFNLKFDLEINSLPLSKHIIFGVQKANVK
jgi:hypothetical protein